MRSSVLPCVFGYAIIASVNDAVWGVGFFDGKGITNKIPNNEPNELEKKVLAVINGRLRDSDIPLDLRGSLFEKKVWEALRTIPYGEKVTYKQLAEKIGMPKAHRAVANACGRNQIAVLIPCHRVIRSDGSLGGYYWGVDIKEKLLARESKCEHNWVMDGHNAGDPICSKCYKYE